MIDIQLLRQNPTDIQLKSQQKGYNVDVEAVLRLDETRRDLINRCEELRSKRNKLIADSKGQKPTEAQIEQGKALRAELASLESQLDSAEAEFLDKLKSIPNMPSIDTPIGDSEDNNVVVYEWGDKPQFDFEFKSHAQICESKGWVDKDRATKVTGTRFAYIKNDLALLHMALVQYGISQLMDADLIAKLIKDNNLNLEAKAFELVLPPLMIKTDMYDAMDRLQPSDDRYKIEGEELWLQGSAEHVLGSMHAGEIIDQQQLPLRYVGLATSFRKEAGTYGKDMDGIFRMHQFDKLEMEVFSSADTSEDEHLLLIAIQEHLMRSLELPYRKIHKCTFDIGKPNARGVDLDVWLPSQDRYRETHTADYMTDYQSRRLKTRYRDASNNLHLVHTNDATAFAQRPLLGIIENNQTKEGHVRIPTVLRPYFGGKEII